VKYLGMGSATQRQALIKVDKTTLKKIELARTEPERMMFKGLKVVCLKQLQVHYKNFKKAVPLVV